MALLSPIATSLLSAKDHAYMHRVIDVDEAATEGILTVDSSDGLNYGSATVNSGVFSMIQGAVASDPTFSITQLTNDVTLAQTIGNMGLTAAVNMGLTSTGGDILLATKLAGKVDWTNGNVIYLGIGDGTDDQVEINAAIAAATAGDTIVLAAGTYTTTDDIDIAQSINIVGQGIGATTIACATTTKNIFDVDAASRISNLSMTYSGALTGVSNFFDIAANLTVENVVMTSTVTGATTCHAFNNTANANTVNLTNVTWNSTGAINQHMFVINSAGNATYNLYECNATCSNGQQNLFGAILIYNGVASTINVYNSNLSDSTDKIGGVAYISTGACNIYNSTLNGSGATNFDANGAGGTLTLYDTTLVNGTTSGTITYGGTVVTKDINVVGGASIGKEAASLIGFYGDTPVNQPDAIADASDAASAISQLNALLATMRELGLIETA